MAGEIRQPNWFQRLVHRILMSKPVSAFLAVVLHRVDKFLLRVTDGRYAFPQLVGLPIIQLTTTGAKSNQPRTMPLVGLFDGDKIALIATSYGRKHSPGWYYNLKAHPECSVLHNGTSRKFIAREMYGQEYQSYWQLGVSYYAGYEKYKERAAHRHIPIMLLEPKK